MSLHTGANNNPPYEPPTLTNEPINIKPMSAGRRASL